MDGPLQSLTLGMEIIRYSAEGKVNESEKEGLLLAMEAKDMLEDRRRDVPFLSDFGNEQLLEIKYVQVNIKEFFRTFLLAYHADTLNRSVILSAKVPPEVSESVLCDGTRLYYALSLFLQATIMHNPIGINIVLDIASEHAHGTVVSRGGHLEAGNQLHNQKLCISITDNGWRKPCQEIEKLVDLWQDQDTSGDHDLHKLNTILR